jgi:hypothetical protein
LTEDQDTTGFGQGLWMCSRIWDITRVRVETLRTFANCIQLTAGLFLLVHSVVFRLRPVSCIQASIRCLGLTTDARPAFIYLPPGVTCGRIIYSGKRMAFFAGFFTGIRAVSREKEHRENIVNHSSILNSSTPALSQQFLHHIYPSPSTLGSRSMGHR